MEKCSRIGQQGFSLLEVLVAVVILAVGILGIAGLQVASMQQNRDSLLRIQAMQIVDSMLDRMRSNPTGTYGGVAFSDTPAIATPTCVNATCSVSDMASFDIAQWQCSINSTKSDGTTYSVCSTYGIAGSLPNGSGEISLASGVYTVSVRWQSSPTGQTSTISVRSAIQ